MNIKIKDKFPDYRIEVYNRKTKKFDTFACFYTYTQAIDRYNEVLKFKRGLFRLIQIVEIDEVGTTSTFRG